MTTACGHVIGVHAVKTMLSVGAGRAPSAISVQYQGNGLSGGIGAEVSVSHTGKGHSCM